GMLLELAQDFDINLQQSYMVGDRLSDIEAGRNAGCQCVWVCSKASEEDIESKLILGKCASLSEAVGIINQDFSSSSS
ncbi:MAG: HAD hydrolase-like protein, partial [Methylococcales bacterium]|nr:HAD hydrolase-like protein [Methylococcales bacterium]